MVICTRTKAVEAVRFWAKRLTCLAVGRSRQCHMVIGALDKGMCNRTESREDAGVF